MCQISLKLTLPAHPSKTAYSYLQLSIRREALALNDTILVMEDESAVLQMTETMLRMFGYNVITAADGEEGLALYEAHEDEIALVLVDLTMPRLSGLEVISALRSASADTKIVLTSGHLDYETVVVEEMVDAYLRKPFRMDDLKATVRLALEGKTGD